LSNQPLTDAQVAAIRTLALPGVALETRTVRVYPNGELAAPILGAAHYEDLALHGDLGLESVYDSILSGTSGRAEYERDRAGREIPHSRRERVRAERGSDLVLTIDTALQAQVERTLVDQVTAQRAQQGVAIIADVHTGDILAMATVVGPNETGYAQLASAHDHNFAVGGAFEPGSTNKVITIASALESDACDVSADRGFTVPWRKENGDRFIQDNSQHADQWWTTRQILALSSNVGTAMIADECHTPETLDAAMRSFGYGTRAGLGLPGEAKGILTPPGQYYDTGLKSTSIGYGVATTPLQVLNVYTTLANGGRSVQPRLVAATVDPDGARHELEIAPGRRVVSAETASSMASMLLGVVAEGTAPCAAVAGYEIAGKTGTTRKIGADGQYLANRNMASFVGFAPATRPELAAIVVLDEPNDQYGGAAAAPVFSEIMQFALRHAAIAPTAPSTQPTQWDAAAAAVADQELDCEVPHGAEVDAIAAAHAGPIADETATAGGTKTEPGRPRERGAEADVVKFLRGRARSDAAGAGTVGEPTQSERRSR
jgi:cell division protein FtsI (penicillin-binding protein 3)